MRLKAARLEIRHALQLARLLEPPAVSGGGGLVGGAGSLLERA